MDSKKISELRDVLDNSSYAIQKKHFLFYC